MTVNNILPIFLKCSSVGLMEDIATASAPAVAQLGSTELLGWSALGIDELRKQKE